MTITLAQNAARVSYSVSEGATQTSFTVSFEFFDDADLNVYVDGTLKTITTHYTVSGGSGSTGAVAISVTGATGGSTVTITRDIALARTTDFPTSGPFQIATLNTELDRFTAIAADLKDSDNRSLILSDFDPSALSALPALADRKGKVLGFNSSTGNPEATQQVTDAAINVSTVSVGGSATGTVSVSNGTATFTLGIPTGATGATGSTGADSTVAGPTGPAGADGADGSSYTHPNHSGEVTSTGDGATVIADNVVDEANLKISNSPTNGQILSAQSGNSGGLTWVDAGGYTLPTAAASTLGGVKIGSNLSINGSGVLSATDTNTTYSIGDGGLTTNDFTDADHSKLNNIAASANNYVHPNHSGEVTSSADGATVVVSNVIDADNLKVTGNGTTSQFLRSDGDGTFTWATPTDTDTVYTLPLATDTVRGGIELFSNTDQSVAANTVSTTAGRTYGVQLNSANQAVVNVPWSDTDTNTTYSVGDGGLTQNNFTDADHSKLNAIEASADVTDTTNVTAAGALMDSEVTNLAEVKAFAASDYATAAQGTLATNALPKAGGTMTGAFKTLTLQETKVNASYASSATTLDLATATVFQSAPSGNVTYTFSNPPASGTAFGFTLAIAPSATATITWPASVDWAGGSAPDAPASGATNVYSFFTTDYGSTYYGFLAGAAMA